MVYNPWPDTAQFSPTASPYTYGAITSIGEVALQDLASTYGTPCYVVDIATIESRIQQWIRAMGDPASISYASKALPVIGIMHLMYQHGLRIDVASGGELATALAAGIPGSAIVLHGNNKTTVELNMALDANIHRIVIDSLDEIDRLAHIGKPVDVLLRLTPGVLSKTHASIETASENQKFGLSIRHGLAEQAIAKVQQTRNITLHGLHVHMGSDIKDPESFSAGIQRIADFADTTHIDLTELNLGGGLGVSYSETDAAPTIADHADTILRAAQAHVDAGTTIMVEPGRSLVGTAGVTLYTVGTVKTVGEKRFVAVDGGLSDNPRPALYQAEHPFAMVTPDQLMGIWSDVTIAGMHCESGDVLATHTQLPEEIRPGDIIVSGVTGAYGYAMASHYNRVPNPPVIAVKQGAHAVLVQGETFAAMHRNDMPVEQLPTWL